jgi:hypothetical protein
MSTISSSHSDITTSQPSPTTLSTIKHDQGIPTILSYPTLTGFAVLYPSPSITQQPHLQPRQPVPIVTTQEYSVFRSSGSTSVLLLSTITRRVKPGSSSAVSNSFDPHKTRIEQKTRTGTCCIAPTVTGNSTQDGVRELPESGGNAAIIGGAVGGGGAVVAFYCVGSMVFYQSEKQDTGEACSAAPD